MDSVMEFLQENYIWIIAVCAFIIFTVIGYFVDRKQKKKFEEKVKNENINKQNEYIQPQTNNSISNEENEMSTDFLNSSNYDLGDINKNNYEQTDEETTTTIENSHDNIEENKTEFNNNQSSETEPITPINTYEDDNSESSYAEPISEKTNELENISRETETNINTNNQDDTYDKNLEYLLGNTKEDNSSVESIDDFLQRTMKEVYEPNYNEQAENADTNIDYEDTLPIPIQKEEDFSKIDVADVDIGSIKENNADEEKTDVDNSVTYNETVENDSINNDVNADTDKKNSEINEEPSVTEETKKEEKDEYATAQIDFKPIEDAILESLGRLSDKE